LPAVTIAGVTGLSSVKARAVELTDVASVTAGGSHTCVVTTAGGVKCWGLNDHGQLGNGSGDELLPVDVPGLASGITAAAAGARHTCARTNSGGLKCWGANFNGALGDGTTTHRAAPVDVLGLSSGVEQVALGSDFTCALNASGGVKCWGLNSYGNLGDGTYAHRHSPTEVSGLGSGVVSISVGHMHACALTTAGAVKCWGGALGVGDFSAVAYGPAPVDVPELGTNVVAISAGGGFTCALKATGAVKCLGTSSNGQLGDPTVSGNARGDYGHFDRRLACMRSQWGGRPRLLGRESLRTTGRWYGRVAFYPGGRCRPFGRRQRL
jgi:alpha-tubulin suppressor-like RCC1 family protein